MGSINCWVTFYSVEHYSLFSSDADLFASLIESWMLSVSMTISPTCKLGVSYLFSVEVARYGEFTVVTDLLLGCPEGLKSFLEVGF